MYVEIRQCKDESPRLRVTYRIRQRSVLCARHPSLLSAGSKALCPDGYVTICNQCDLEGLFLFCDTPT